MWATVASVDTMHVNRAQSCADATVANGIVVRVVTTFRFPVSQVRSVAGCGIQFKVIFE